MKSSSHIHSLGVLALIGLWVLTGSTSGPAQDEDPGEIEDVSGGTRDIYGRLKRPKPGQKDPLDGAWQLVDLNADGYPKEGMNASGYLVISGGFMAFHLQVYWPEAKRGQELEDGYQAFVAEYTRTGDQLTCQTLIGAYMDEGDDRLEYEGDLPLRVYSATMSGDLLNLRWGDGDVMIFGRRLHSRVRAQNLFGNKRLTRPDQDPDVYGRGDDEAPPDGDKEGDG